MALAPKRLAQFVASSSENTEYTVPASTTAIVKNIVIANTSGSDVTLGLSLVPSGGSAGDSNRIIPGTMIPAGAVVPFDVTQVMEAGDFLSAIAGAATSLTVTISGLEG